MKCKSLVFVAQVDTLTSSRNNMDYSMDDQTEQRHENVLSDGRYLPA